MIRIEKTQSKDFQFFLSQKNFLKVVDTLEKFQEGMLDKNSAQAKNFMLFKRELYQMYQISNRSVHEHELYSFQIQRDNLKWLIRANNDYITEMNKLEAMEEAADFAALNGAVYRKRALNTRRFKGLGAFAASYGIYTYLPYIAVYLGSTIPMVSACFAGFYGLIAFAENQLINEIRVIPAGEHSGKLQVTRALSPFVSENLIVEVKNIKSVVALGDEELGEDSKDGNIVLISEHINAAGETDTEPLVLSLQGDAFKDKLYLDWILSNKDGESSLVDDYE